MEYPGVLILASHDRYMLDKLADHIFVFEGDGVIKDFPGGYTAYSIWKESEEAEKVVEAAVKSTATQEVPTIDRNEVRKALRRTEKSIEQLEATKKKLENNFLLPDPSLQDLQKWDKELHATIAQLHEMETTWLELSEQLESFA
jgi:ATP-binding cassette subfamily F protein uup